MEKTKEVISLLFSRVDFVLIVVGAGAFGYFFFFATKDDVRAVHDDVQALEVRVVRIEARLDSIDQRLDDMNKRLDDMNKRLEDIIFFLRTNSEQIRANNKMMTGHLQNDHNKKP